MQEKWHMLTGIETVRGWCTEHKAPIFWTIGKEWRKAISTVADLQNNGRRTDTEVQQALQALASIDPAVLNDDSLISSALLDVIGTKYNAVFSESRDFIITRAKLKLGNDMSAWEASDLSAVQ